MFNKFKRCDGRTKVIVAPQANSGEFFNKDGNRAAISERSVIVEDCNWLAPKDDMLGTLYRRNKTSPENVLSRYQKSNEIEGKATDDEKPHQGPKDMQARLSSNVVPRYGAFPGEVKSVVLAGTIGSIASFSGSKLFSTVVGDADKVDVDIFNNFNFPMENLVFEGGGNKGMAYVGTLKVFRQLFFFTFSILVTSQC